MSMNIKKGDKVVVLNTRRQKDKNGKPKTVTGKVLSVIPEKEQVIVEGYNMVSKHQKPKGRADQGGIVKKEAPAKKFCKSRTTPTILKDLSLSATRAY